VIDIPCFYDGKLFPIAPFISIVVTHENDQLRLSAGYFPADEAFFLFADTIIKGVYYKFEKVLLSEFQFDQIGPDSNRKHITLRRFAWPLLFKLRNDIETMKVEDKYNLENTNLVAIGG
jgi:hypothetical protein